MIEDRCLKGKIEIISDIVCHSLKKNPTSDKFAIPKSNSM